MDKRKARIISTGSYLPEKVLSNKDLETIVDTTDEWIQTRTGMKERRIASDDQFSSTLGALAAKKALEKANMSVHDIDFIIVATLSPDYIFPSTGCLIQEELGASCAAVDIQAACSGNLFALSMAKAYIESGMYNNILVIASEKLSSITDYEDRGTCILFGDGAAASIVSNKGSGLSIEEISLGSDGSQQHLLWMPGGGCREPASEQTVKDRKHFIKMSGREVFKHAVRRMESAAEECVSKLNLSEDDIAYIVPHQANVRIIEAVAKRFRVPMERVYMTIHKYGNTSSSACAIALDEFLGEQKLKDGENLLMVAFGAGFTWGSAVLKKVKE